jgi:hypothetical protein
MTTVQLWYDYEPCLDGALRMFAGHAAISPDACAGLFEEGVRRVAFKDPVDLGSPAALDALILVRELTGFGFAVDWQVRLPNAYDANWRLLSHLFPPSRTQPDPEVQRTWRRDYHFFKCVYRRGPGFLQIRDRRTGSLRKMTIKDPGARRVVDRLVAGAPVRELPSGVLNGLTKAGLVGVLGERAWWLPYRARGWPLSPDII